MPHSLSGSLKHEILYEREIKIRQKFHVTSDRMSTKKRMCVLWCYQLTKDIALHFSSLHGNQSSTEKKNMYVNVFPDDQGPKSPMFMDMGILCI